MKGNNPKKQFFKGDNSESQPQRNSGRGDSKGRGRKTDSADHEFDLGKRSFDSVMEKPVSHPLAKRKTSNPIPQSL